MEPHRDISSPRGSRDAALDVFRGIAILEVVIHHVTGFARLHAHPATPTKLLYTAANRTIHFAVPAFLFLMALLLARSMWKGKWSWPVFYGRRAQQTVVPYLIWTVAYAFFALWQGKTTWTGVQRWETWAHWLVWGKAWEHLYFLVLALQLYLVFPLVLAWLRRTRASLGTTLLLAALAQLAIYWIHYAWIRSPYPGSLLIWHLIPVTAGALVGARLESWDEWWHRFRFLFIALAVIGWAAYVPQGVRELRGLPIHPFPYQVALWTYTTGVCFCLVALCRAIVASRAARLARGLQYLGGHSMPIYLLHPALLFFWYKTVPAGTTLVLHLTVLLAVSGAIVVSLLLSLAARRARVAAVLFGRGDSPLAPLPTRT